MKPDTLQPQSRNHTGAQSQDEKGTEEAGVLLNRVFITSLMEEYLLKCLFIALAF